MMMVDHWVDLGPALSFTFSQSTTQPVAYMEGLCWQINHKFEIVIIKFSHKNIQNVFFNTQQ